MTTVGSPRVAAAIDIGSNSVKMTVARADGAGEIEQFDWMTTPVLLGRGLEMNGRLDEGRIDAAVQTLQSYAARARELGAERVVAVATEATRAAANGVEFLERVRNETGIEVRVIDGKEEADLTFRGLSVTNDLSGAVIVADIGGGSTEVIAVQDGTVVASKSLALGSARFTDRLVRSDPPSVEELTACEDEATSLLSGLGKAFSRSARGGSRLLILGGTGEYLQRLVGPEPEQDVDLPAIRRVQEMLTTMPAAELSAVAEIPEARARVLPAGSAIVTALISRFQPERIEIARSGIRTGLLLDLFAEPDLGPSEDRVNVGVQDSPHDEESFRETMRLLIADRWGVVWKTIPAAIEGTDIEGVHDVRVASRRLRAAMDVAAPCFPAKWFRPLHRAAKEITGALGEVRDRDVLVEALRADRSSAPITEHPGIDRLIARVERERVLARTEMERYLKSLVEGSLQSEVERRFGMPNQASQPKSSRPRVRT